MLVSPSTPRLPLFWSLSSSTLKKHVCYSILKLLYWYYKYQKNICYSSFQVYSCASYRHCCNILKALARSLLIKVTIVTCSEGACKVSSNRVQCYLAIVTAFLCANIFQFDAAVGKIVLILWAEALQISNTANHGWI